MTSAKSSPPPAWSHCSLRGDERAWKTMYSAHEIAELKYKHSHPTLERQIGTQVFPRPPPPPTNDEFLDFKRPPEPSVAVVGEKEEPTSFRNVPDLSYMPSSGHVIASEFSTLKNPVGKVNVFDDGGKIVSSFKTEGNGTDMSSFGVTSLRHNTNDNDKIAVCTGDGVGVWSVAGQLVNYMCHDKVQNCCHITSLEGGLLASCDVKSHDDYCISTWDKRSSQPLVSQFAWRREPKVAVRQKHIGSPWFITSDSTGNLHIADRRCGCVKVFQAKSGCFVRQYDVTGVDSRCHRGAMSPHGLAADADGNVLVVDEVSEKTLLFDRHGEFVRSLDYRGGSGQMWSIALKEAGSSSAKVAVSLVDQNVPLLRIYKMNFAEKRRIS